MRSTDRSRPARREPVRMQRIAVVAPVDRLRDALVGVARSGAVQLDDAVDGTVEGAAAAALRRTGGSAAAARLAAHPVDPVALARSGRADLLAGEAQLERYAAGAVTDDGVAAWAGWCPADRLERLRDTLAAVEAAAVSLRRPPGAVAPTLLRQDTAVRASFAPLVSTYGTVPYADVDPTVFAGVAFIVMFGVMFADAGHGMLLVIAALVLRASHRPRWRRLRRMWPFVAGAGVASAVAGAALGEFFGPTGVVPVQWLSPLDKPVRLLAAGVGLGALLLAVGYLVGTVNRWREGGARVALYAPSGIAGAALFAGLGALAVGLYLGHWAIAGPGAVVAGVALILAGAGLYAGSGGGGAGLAQTGVQLFDLVIRLGANLVSFARLAAFGLTHAALGALVWAGVTVLWGAGGAAALVGAVLLFVVGNAVTFGLEALVAGIQALRLEYYELFSRVFEGEGRPFRPWTVEVEGVP
ncbi:V/A-type H+-transporting ATPase subunit I [Krasilnikovia cinnamomea]|uniref:V/A-type H+-transporting ATPase subunit I n=1 Tax=Krasilnikovia cinnamomea TaxID=349313 RepID=A0A4Q7ZRE7_9ACTN|nr:V-type ATPase 116kDa subunit family protein [Krasilnikovia cinnamomea]RZU53394.1 V/A-type H+-transporting ATPase subunit I [Krasilnikovia cinnamomea]